MINILYTNNEPVTKRQSVGNYSGPYTNTNPKNRADHILIRRHSLFRLLDYPKGPCARIVYDLEAVALETVAVYDFTTQVPYC